MVRREGQRFGVHTNNTLKYNSEIERGLQTMKSTLHVTVSIKASTTPFNKKATTFLTQTIHYSLNKHNRWELLDNSNNNNIELNHNIGKDIYFCKENVKEENKKERKEKNKLNKKNNFERQLNKNKYLLRKELKELNKEKSKEAQQSLDEKNATLEEVHDEVTIRVKKQDKKSHLIYLNDCGNCNEKEGDIWIQLAPTREEIYERFQSRNGEYNSELDICYDRRESRKLKKERFFKSIFI
ncbi:hypothetical protein ABK040_000481 [Willaertia magna]